MTDLTHIRPTQKHWQLAGDAGGIVAGFDDIERSIENILRTRLNTDILRPLFGSNYHDYIDTPQDVFVPNAVREVVLAIKIWETRAIVERVEFSGAAPQITMIVFWHVRDDVAKTIRNTQVVVHV